MKNTKKKKAVLKKLKAKVAKTNAKHRADIARLGQEIEREIKTMGCIQNPPKRRRRRKGSGSGR